MREERKDGQEKKKGQADLVSVERAANTTLRTSEKRPMGSSGRGRYIFQTEADSPMFDRRCWRVHWRPRGRTANEMLPSPELAHIVASSATGVGPGRGKDRQRPVGFGSSVLL